MYQKRYDEALVNLDKLERTLMKGHSLTDEIYWLRSNIYNAIGRDDAAIVNLKKVVDGKRDIYTDNALITLAHLYEKKGELEEAQNYYKEILLNHSGSIYVAEARKKFRVLRGEKVAN